MIFYFNGSARNVGTRWKVRDSLEYEMAAKEKFYERISKSEIEDEISNQEMNYARKK
jgi:hypothetical protein